ncbi:unnamed protein product, partial [marine sediment metagenome]
LEASRDLGKCRDRIRKLKEKRAEENPHAKNVNRLIMRELRERLSLTVAEAVENKLRDEEAALRFWEEGFGTKGVRSLMIDSVLPFLNKRVQDYNTQLTDAQFIITFDTETTLKSGKSKEAFTINVEDKDGAEDYQGLSMGQRAKVDVCVGLALQDLAQLRSSSAINFAFFDEPFERLDPVAKDRVIELLTGTLQRDTMFVVTHDEALKAHFSERLTLVKRKGKATIE